MDIRTKFKYPTQEEIESINDKAPGISRFGFPMCFPTDFEDLTVLHRYDNLHSWDMLLHSKIADFDTCYMYVLIHLKRGVPKTSTEVISNEPFRINYTNVNFYLGYLLFCFQAINDNILQIINLHFMLGFKEKDVKREKIVEKLKLNYQSISIATVDFYGKIKNLVELRNSITHRFSALEIDRRAHLFTDKKIVMPMSNELPDYEILMKTVEHSVFELKKYIEVLKVNMIINPLNK